MGRSRAGKRGESEGEGGDARVGLGLNVAQSFTLLYRRLSACF